MTYVVAFGVENTSGNRLNCMAANGGTGDPIYPQNKDELVERADRHLRFQIREEASAFASAAVPSVAGQRRRQDLPHRPSRRSTALRCGRAGSTPS